MNKIVVAMIMSVVVASPALANEGRTELHGGIAFGKDSFGDSASEAIGGFALGYDLDLGSAFVGAEISGDKLLAAGNNRVGLGVGARGGVPLGKGKLYGQGGYTTKFCDVCTGTWNLGTGYQHDFGKLIGKIDYRHYFVKDGGYDMNAVTVGFGLKF